jgi:hypothetical protein
MSPTYIEMWKYADWRGTLATGVWRIRITTATFIIYDVSAKIRNQWWHSRYRKCINLGHNATNTGEWVNQYVHKDKYRRIDPCHLSRIFKYSHFRTSCWCMGSVMSPNFCFWLPMFIVPLTRQITRWYVSMSSYDRLIGSITEGVPLKIRQSHKSRKWHDVFP